MLRLLLENVRTFVGKHDIPLRPLTLLVGENSSGKTTVLAALSALCDRDTYPLRPDFNRAPYNLGTFETIASRYRRAAQRLETFSLGYRRDASAESPDDFSQVEASYRNYRGQPLISSFHAHNATLDFELAVSDVKSGTISGDCAYKSNNSARVSYPFSVELKLMDRPYLPLLDIAVQSSHSRAQDAPAASAPQFPPQSLITALLHVQPITLYSIAPIRTQPQRTYNPISAVYGPTGEHVPFLLDQLLADEPDSTDTQKVLAALKQFGVEAGLYSRVFVRRLSKKGAQPFQIFARLDHTPVNIIDVGYGVSQSLPVVVQTAILPPRQTLLVQQPEVHLHPRAQAALGTLFSSVVATTSIQLIVETHSDYIIDRVRQEVARKLLKPLDVGIVYLHRSGLRTRTHLLELDDAGKFINPPKYYRHFFLQERMNILRQGI